MNKQKMKWLTKLVQSFCIIYNLKLLSVGPIYSQTENKIL